MINERVAEFFDGTTVQIPAGDSGYLLLALGLQSGERVFNLSDYAPLGICEASITKQPDLTIRGQTVQL